MNEKKLIIGGSFQGKLQIGRALCKIANSVDQVYRVYCGLATKIKG